MKINVRSVSMIILGSLAENVPVKLEIVVFIMLQQRNVNVIMD